MSHYDGTANYAGAEWFWATSTMKKLEDIPGILVIKDLAAGSVAGMAGVVLGHPLDVVKTRVQATTSAMRSLSATECLRTTMREEGWAGLWRGIGPPLFAVAWWQGIVFASYEWSFAKFKVAGVEEETARLYAGMTSGAASCLVTVPTDAVKIHMQLEQGLGGGAIRDSLRCGQQMVAASGVSSLFRGMSSCLLRDVPSITIYLGSYSKLKETCMLQFGAEAGSEGWRALAAESLAGGLAGSISWAAACPMDMVKTVQQEAAAGGQPLNLMGACRRIHELDGARGFLRGFGPLVVRAFPVNAVTFLLYEKAKRLFGVPSTL